MQTEAWDFSQLALVTRNLKEACFSSSFLSSGNLDIWINVGNCYSFSDEKDILYLPSIAIVLSWPRFVVSNVINLHMVIVGVSQRTLNLHTKNKAEND